MNLDFYKKKVTSNPLPIVVDFWAPWCGPCKAMAPILEEVSKEYKGKVDLWKVNVDENPEIAKAMGIMGIPTTIGYSNGIVAFKKTGFLPKPNIEKLFSELTTGKTSIVIPISIFDRVLRLVVGSGLAIFGALQGPAALFIPLGAIIAFSAVYDRCPIYQALSSKLKSLFIKESGSSN